MSLYHLVILLLGFTCGVALESLTNQNLYFIVWVLLLAVGVALVWRRGSKASATPHLLSICIFFLAFSVGSIRTQVYETQFTDSLDEQVGKEVTFSGEVLKEPDRRSSQQFLFITSGESTIRVSTDNYAVVSYGDIVSVTGKLERPASFTTDLGREFDYANYLRAKGVEYTVSFASVTVDEAGQGNPIITALLNTKQAFMLQLDQVLQEPGGALADGLLLGLNQGLGEDLEEDFRRSGIIHIVVLSGYNIMLVVTFVMFLLSFFLRQHWRMLVGLGAIIAFALIVGLSATVVRASIMASLLLIAQTFGRSYDVLRALLIAGFLMILINPYLLLFDIGFQLSFMATLGLISALPWLGSKEQPEVLTSVKGYVVATVATQIAVLPLLLYHIGQVSLVAVMVNVLVLPVVPLAMFGAFISALVYPLFASVGLALGMVTQLFLSYIIFVASWFSSLSIATVTFGEVSPWWVLGLYAGIGFLYWLYQNKYVVTERSFNDWEIVEEENIKTDTDKESAPVEDSIPKLFR